MTPSYCVLLSWNVTILFILSLPTLWQLRSWGGFVIGLAIVLIVAALVAARGDLTGDDWDRNEPRTFKMFLGDFMYVLSGPLLMVLPLIAFTVFISPIFVLVALWKSFSWGWIVVVSLPILILVGVVVYTVMKQDSN